MVSRGTSCRRVASGTTRLNPTSGIAAHRDDPRVVEARDSIKRFGAAAVANLATLR
jgi:hypothetical protein